MVKFLLNSRNSHNRVVHKHQLYQINQFILRNHSTKVVKRLSPAASSSSSLICTQTLNNDIYPQCVAAAAYTEEDSIQMGFHTHPPSHPASQ